MSVISRDPINGVADVDCTPLDIDVVWEGVEHAVRSNITFFGKSPGYWQRLIHDAAQSLADEADDYEYEEWDIRTYERMPSVR